MKRILILVMFALPYLAHSQTPVVRLEAATGKQVFDLKKDRGKFVALHFLLKTECPYCIKHTQDYIAKSKTLPEVKQVFIKPDSELEIQAWAQKLSSSDSENFPIYRDPDARLAKQFKIPDGYRFRGQVVHYPATILIDPKGKEVYRYVGKNNTDRFSFEQLALKVKEFE